MIERRRDKVSQQEFYERYVWANRPVIMSGVTEYWPAARHWTPELLKSLCGDQPVQILANRSANPQYELSYDQHRREVRFAEYVDMVLQNPDSNDIYLHAQNQFMNTPIAGERLYGYIPPLADYLNETSKRGNTFVWFGPGGTVTPLHHDENDILFVQVYGHKRWTILSPRQKPLVYNDRHVFSAVDAENPDLIRYPLYRFTDSSTFNLNPGEVLFLPIKWWHHVRALDVSISLSFTNFYQQEATTAPAYSG